MTQTIYRAATMPARAAMLPFRAAGIGPPLRRAGGIQPPQPQPPSPGMSPGIPNYDNVSRGGMGGFGAFGFGTPIGDATPTPFDTSAHRMAGQQYLHELQGVVAGMRHPGLGGAYNGAGGDDGIARAGAPMPGLAPQRSRFNPLTNRYEGSQLGGGYQNPQAMAASQFQGATPGIGTSSGGVQRPMWMAPPVAGQVDRSVRNPMSVHLATARNPTLSPTASGMGLVGSPNPDFARPNAEQLAANRLEYQARRDTAQGARQAGVTENAVARADQRRLRQGNLTMDERMQMGIPGLAVAREMAGAQAGMADKQLAAQERQGQLTRDFQLAMATGDREAAATARGEMAGLQRDMKKWEIEAQTAQRDSSDKRFEAQFGLQKRGVEAKERDSLIGQANSYQAEADRYADQGDLARSERAQQQADQYRAMVPSPDGGIPQQTPGLPGAPGGATSRSWSSLPLALRKQIQAVGPDQLVSAITELFPGISQEELDKMIQDVTRDSTASAYDPGGRGLENIAGGFFGYENFNRFIGSNEKSPRMDFGFGIPGLRNIPRPVIPGPIGGIAAGFGW